MEQIAKISIPVFLFWSLNLFSQQTSISGVVSIHNSLFETGKIKYVYLAQVEEKFGNSHVTTTDLNGNFHLPLIGISKGKQFDFTVFKEGLEVVNFDQLTAIAGQQDAIKVSMARPKYLADFRKNIYRVGKTKAEEVLEIKIQKTEEDLSQAQKQTNIDQNRIRALQNEYSKLRIAYERIDEQASNLAERYSRINLDAVSGLFKKAFRYFQKGELEAAIDILNTGTLKNQIQEIRKEENKIHSVQNELNERDSIVKRRIAETIQALKFKVEIQLTLFEEVDSIEYTLYQILQLDSTNVDNLRATGGFYRSFVNSQPKAITYFQKALRHSKTDEEKAINLNDLGVQYKDNREYGRAESVLLQALKIRQRLAITDPDKFEPEVAATRSNLGLLYLRMGKHEIAEDHLLKAVQIDQKYSSLDSIRSKLHLSYALNNLGMVYRQKLEYPKALKAYWGSLDLKKQIAKSHPSYASEVAVTQINIGNLYLVADMYAEAEESYLEALKIFRLASKKFSLKFYPDLALVLNNLGSLYYEMGQNQQAETMLLEALEIREKLVKINSQRFMADLVNTQMEVAIMYSKSGNYEESLFFLNKGILAYRGLINIYPAQYDFYLAKALTLKAHVLIESNRKEGSLEFLSEAKSIIQTLPHSPYSTVLLREIEQLIEN